jgi:DNA gyrase subunit B
VFVDAELSFDTISQRLRESAYLNKGLWITLVDERANRERSFYFEGGLVSFVRHLNRHKEVLHARPIAVEKRDGATTIEVALQYNDSFTENVFAFANNINTVDGGTHITGFRAALTSSLNDWARRAGVLKDNDANLSGDDVREGLTAVVSVKLVEPQFEGQTKAKLGNAEIKGQVQAAVAEGIAQHLDENPADGREALLDDPAAVPSAGDAHLFRAGTGIFLPLGQRPAHRKRRPRAARRGHSRYWRSAGLCAIARRGADRGRERREGS